MFKIKALEAATLVGTDRDIQIPEGTILEVQSIEGWKYGCLDYAEITVKIKGMGNQNWDFVIDNYEVVK